jgi:Xaa-Pro dipeptidase
MNLHFTREEFAERREAACAEMREQGLDALLLFRQESLYYLTGFDTFGYVYFQCLILDADGNMTLLTRSPDLRQAQWTSVIEDIRIWVDKEGSRPSDQLCGLLKELGHGDKAKLGVEWHAFGLTAAVGFTLRDALARLGAEVSDASDLVSRLRLVKSPAELAYVRRAAELADEAYAVACELAVPGAFEGDILAGMQGVIFSGGGDDPANETIIGSGEGALMCRYFTGRRHLSPEDQLTLEYAAVYRHYHACLMRTICLGTPPQDQLDMHLVCLDSLNAAKAELRPGNPLGEVFDAHARVFDDAGHRDNRLNACGYSLGATFAPSWMDFAERSMFFHGNSTIAEPGMVFFIHIICFDSEKGLAMSSGQTLEVTEHGCEALTRAPLELVTN